MSAPDPDTPADPPLARRLTVRQLFGLMVGMLALSAALFWWDANRAPAVERTVVTAPGWQTVRVLDAELTTAPLLLGETAVFVGSLPEERRASVTAVDVISGDVRWRHDQTTQSRPDLWPQAWRWRWPFAWRWGPLAAADELVVVGDAFAFTTSVTALNLADGALRWQREVGFLNGSDVSWMQTVNGRVAAASRSNATTYFAILDPATGWIDYQRSVESSGLFWHEAETERTFFATAAGVRVVGDRPWQQPLSGCGAVPTLLETTLLVQVISCGNGQVSQLLALDRENGRLLWQLDTPLVSNVAVSADTVAALSVDGELLLLNLADGAPRQTLRFTTPLTPPDDETAYYVALDEENGRFLVYFGDSHQLFVLQMGSQ